MVNISCRSTELVQCHFVEELCRSHQSLKTSVGFAANRSGRRPGEVDTARGMFGDETASRDGAVEDDEKSDAAVGLLDLSM